MKKLAIIMTGGGMKATYSVGALLALIEKFDLKNPEMIIAGSASAGTASYFTSGQHDSIKNIWGELLSTKKLINLWKFWKIFNTDYIIDEVFKKQDILNEEEVYSSKIKEFISVTNAKTGKVEFFSNKDEKDIFEIMRATKAIPIVYNKKIKIGNSKYIDTYLSSLGVNLKIQKAEQEGAGKIIIISPLQINENYFVKLNGDISNNIFRIWLNFQSKEFKENYNKQLELDKQKHNYRNLEILTLTPKIPLKIKMLDNNYIIMNKTILQGYDETIENKEIGKFLV